MTVLKSREEIAARLQRSIVATESRWKGAGRERGAEFAANEATIDQLDHLAEAHDLGFDLETVWPTVLQFLKIEKMQCEYEELTLRQYEAWVGGFLCGATEVLRAVEWGSDARPDPEPS